MVKLGAFGDVLVLVSIVWVKINNARVCSAA